MDLREEFKKEDGFCDEYVECLEAKVKKLSLHNVSQQRELLLAFLEFYHNPKYNTVNTTFSEDVDMFLANNCG
jgi:hypothetical protein